jgi:transcriptional regulator with XRE-family HTH domain
VVNIESGRQRPPVHLLWELAGALNVEIAHLLPQRRELAEGGAPVQLDDRVVAYIEQAAQDDPSTRRLLLDFIQRATAKIDDADAPDAPTRRAAPPSRTRRITAATQSSSDPSADG